MAQVGDIYQVIMVHNFISYGGSYLFRRFDANKLNEVLVG